MEVPGGTPTPFYGCPYCEGSTPPSTRSTAHPKGAPPPPAPPAPSHPAQHLPLPGVPTVCPPPPSKPSLVLAACHCLKITPAFRGAAGDLAGGLAAVKSSRPPRPPPPSQCLCPIWPRSAPAPASHARAWGHGLAWGLGWEGHEGVQRWGNRGAALCKITPKGAERTDGSSSPRTPLSPLSDTATPQCQPAS